jgi:hypothetical protein
VAIGQTTVIVRGAPKRPPIAIPDDAARAAMIIERIRSCCPEIRTRTFAGTA